MSRYIAALMLALTVVPVPASAETGYDLWLRYTPVEDLRLKDTYRGAISAIVVESHSDTARIIVRELQRGTKGLLGADVRIAPRVDADGTLVIGTPTTSPLIAKLDWSEPLASVGEDGYVIRSATISNHAVTVIAARSDIGALYGTFHLLRLMQTRQPIAALDITQRPHLQRRLLNHWDNLNGTIERGYAGASLWYSTPTRTTRASGARMSDLPDRVDPRIEDYARANASIGINGSVINNVNANPQSLTRPYLEKAAALARVMRPYGIHVYLSANFAAPKALGELTTADPLDPAVAKWWKAKADEIYRLIPDFGGFLVKANSEGQPGPQDYHRTHADGANMLADALAPHGGVVMWRAFVYDEKVDPDRVKRAYIEFVPLDGTFRDNVFVQVKNGPLDFQPREPFHPMFGAMPKTPLMPELQITQEYMGQSTHLVYLAPMWKEFFDSDTYAAGPGSTVAKVVEGRLQGQKQTGIAGVANTGRDINWTGHHFAQANWYAYGRLAWDPSLGADTIADEWIKMTWSHTPDVVAMIKSIMLDSHEAYVDYTMPLGLHHMIGGNHYAPMPENVDPRRADWSATFYHHADANGIGFDRTPTGSNAVAQYRSPLRENFTDPYSTPEKYLLWFHHLPWNFTLAFGDSLWNELVRHYTRGVEQARSMEARWTSLEGKVDAERYQAVLAKLHQQAADAAAWREKCLTYFQQFSKKEIRSN